MVRWIAVAASLLCASVASAQDIVVTAANSPYVLTTGQTFNSITLQSGGLVRVDGAATVTLPIAVPAGSTLQLNSSSALDNLNVGAIGGTLWVSQPITWESAALTVSGRLTLDSTLTVNGDFTLSAAAVMDHTAGDVDFQLTVSGIADLQGLVDVSGRGLDRYQQITPTLPAAGREAGGSHGGVGGGNTNAMYDDPLNPTMLGAGGCADVYGGGGVRGGGKVSITAGTIKIGAGINANGLNANSSNSGAGAGGSVLLRANTLQGTGAVLARGGTGQNRGGGGGGRVAIYAPTNTWTGGVSTSGGGGGWPGSLGSVFISNNATPAAISINGGYFRLSATDSYASVTLLSGGELHLDGAATVTQTINVPSGSTLHIDSSSALDNLNVGTLAGVLVVNVPLTWESAAMTVTGRLTLNDALTVNGNFTLGSTGVIDHYAGDTGFQLTVSGIADLQGGIDVSGRGLYTGQDISPTLPAAGAEAGGSHGGFGGGGNRNGTYDDPLNPTMLGAAGASDVYGGGGVRGGGKVSITAGTLKVGGGILANGANANSSNSGAGAGGSILIHATTLQGAGGIQAQGGDASNRGGGGGGRIAIYATTNTWTGGASAAGGGSNYGSYRGTPGSVYIADNSTPPSITVGGGAFHVTGGDAFTSVTLTNGGELYLDGPATVTQPITLTSGATVYVNSSDALDNLNLGALNGTLVVNVPLIWETAAMTVNGRLTLNNTLTVNGNLTLGSAGVIDHWVGDPDFQLTVTGIADLQGLVDASARGLAPGQSISPTIPAAGAEGGGSYGGVGGGNSNSVYGDPLNPTLLGAGGATDVYGGGGVRGGGKVSITAGTLKIGGGILANGAGASSSNSGGGAGGSILIHATTVSGVGGIQARGGNGQNRGAGGGGRIALYATTNTWTGSVTAAGGTSGGADGTLGSVYFSDTSTPAAIATGGGYFHLASTDTFASVKLLPGAELHIDGAANVTQTIDIPAGTTLFLDGSTALDNLNIGTIAGNLVVDVPVTWETASMTVPGRLTLNNALTVNGNFTLPSTGVVDHWPGDPDFQLTVTGIADLQGVVDVSAKGYAPGQKISVNVNAPSAEGGGSHGGVGGGNTNALYDDELLPAMMGAGGTWDVYGGGGARGGGKISITAGTLKIVGAIYANGQSATSSNSGAGAGGAILIQATTLQGSGPVQARGGNGQNRGAGGGGRVAIYAPTNQWTGTVSAAGGTGGYAGTMGSSLVSDNAATPAIKVGGGYFRTESPSASYASVTMLAGGELDVDHSLTVTQPISVPAGAAVMLNDAAALTGVTFGTVAGTVNVNAAIVSTADMTVGGTLNVNEPFTMNNLTVTGTARVDDALTVQNLTVQSGGLVTHSNGVSTCTIDASQTVTIAAGGKIDVSGKGLGTNVTLDPLTLLPTSGSGSGVGGSHGGLGGPNGATVARARYDAQYQPVLLGAGASSNGSLVGGAGGGRLKLTANALSLGGQIFANGASPGGAGGSVWITVNSISGAGTIRADGGPAVNGAGGGVTGGGGGRVAVEHETGSFTGQLSALGGAPYSGNASVAGGLGSSWIRKGQNGALTVMNGEHFLSAGESFASVSLSGNAVLRLSGSASVTAPISVPTGSTVILDSADALNGVVLGNAILGGLVVNAAAQLPGTRSFSGPLQVSAQLDLGDATLNGTSVTFVDARLNCSGGLTAESGAIIRHSATSRGFDVRVARKLWLKTGAWIDVRGLGLRGGGLGAYGCNGTALDPLTLAEASGAARNGGGSFGALGGGTTNALYGSTTDVQYPGASGGCGTANTDYGGAGGGLVRLQAAQLQVDGIIDATGAAGLLAAGAGSGGGIYAITNELSGAGSIRANGGNAATGNAGGGGRIYLEVGADLFTGTRTATGGTSTSLGSGGSSQPNTVVTTLTPAIVSSPNTVAAVGQPWSYDADGKPEVVGASSVTWSLPGAPSGATIDSTTGLISWTPSTVGVGSFTVRATAVNGTADQTFNVQILSPPKVTSSANTGGQLDTPYAYGPGNILTVTGSAPMTYAVTVAPPGNPALTVDGAGKVTWTPTSLGTHNACIRVSNAVGFDDHCFSVVVTANNAPPKITSAPPSAAQVNVLYGYQPTVTGTAPISFSFFQSNSPVGATIDSASGAVSYTPAATGSVGFCIQAQNAAGSDVQCWQVAVSGPPTAPQIVSSCNHLATVSRAYAYDADNKAEAIGSSPIVFSLVSGPNGMSVASDGTVSWAPDQPGGTSFTIKAANSAGEITQDCPVSVRTVDGSGPAVILREPNLLAAVGVPYRYSADGKIHAEGDAPITFSKISGPSNLVVDSTTGAVSWTPSTVGDQNVTVKAQNAAGSDTFSFTVKVASQPPAPPVAKFTLTPATGDAPLKVDFDASSSSATGGILSTSFAFGDGSPDEEGTTLQHTYATCGGFVVRLHVFDRYGQSSIAEQTVPVTCNGNTPPSAKIVAVMVESPGSTSVAFSCDCQKGSGDIAAYQWSTTDGYFTDQPSGTHVFPPGAHSLRLAVIDTNGLTAVDDVTVYAFATDGKKPPTVTARASPAASAAPATVKFSVETTDPDGQVTQVKWKFSDGAETTERAPTRTYANPTVDHVKVEVTDNDGLVSTGVVDVTVLAADSSVPPSFLSQPNTEATAGEPYSYDKDGLPSVKGTGPFTFDLLLAPDGAKVDAATGKIDWAIPATQTDPVQFSLRVKSAVGSSVQNWDVNVSAVTVVAPPAETKKGCGCDGTAGVAPLALLVMAAILIRRRRSNELRG